MGFGDLKDAMRFREIISTIATDVVDTLRPEVKIGKVYSANASTQIARILFPGETTSSLVTVHCARNMTPVKTMDSTFATNGYDAPGDIVRVAGKPGSYYIADFISGGPFDTGWVDISLAVPNVPVSSVTYSKLRRVGNTVHCRSLFKLSAGIGPALINLPYDYATGTPISVIFVMGQCRAIRQGVGTFHGAIVPNQFSGPARAAIWTETGFAQWNATVPATWASGDDWSLDYVYEAAPL